MHKKITNRVLDSVPTPEDKELFLRDTGLKGFGARITSNGSISFFAEGRLRKGRTKRISLGRYPVISVAEARLKAREALHQFYCGIDLGCHDIEPKKSNTSSPQLTLAQVLNRYCASRTLKSEQDYRRVIERLFSDWLDQPVARITRDDIEKRYRQVAYQDGHKAQAAKGMRYLNTVLNFALNEEVNGAPLLYQNPVQILSDKRCDRSVKPRKTFIEIHQLPAWVDAVKSLCTPSARDLLLLQVQTGLRDGESKGLRWADVDFDRRCFSVRDTKNGSDFTIPMSTQIYGLLLERKHQALSKTYVFPNKTNTGPVTSIRKQMDKVRNETMIAFTHHCLRRTFATVLKKELDIDIPTISILLNHSPQGVTQRHYLVSVPMDFRAVYQRLSALFCNDPQLGHASTDVVQSISKLNYSQ